MAGLSARALAHGAAVAIVGLAACTLAPEIVIDDVVPRRSVNEVEAIVVAQLEDAAERFGALAPIRIVRVVATQEGRAVRFEPSWTAEDPDRVVWLVRAEGTFVSLRGPDPGPLTAERGFYVIDDASGEIIGFGFLP
jgi:hypothetical protein